MTDTNKPETTKGVTDSHASKPNAHAEGDAAKTTAKRSHDAAEKNPVSETGSRATDTGDGMTDQDIRESRNASVDPKQAKKVEALLSSLDSMINDLGQTISKNLLSDHKPDRMGVNDLKVQLSALQSARAVIVSYAPGGGVQVTQGLIS